MTYEQWIAWRKKLSRRLGCAMKRLPPKKKHEVWNAYARVWKRKGGMMFIHPPLKDEGQ